MGFIMKWIGITGGIGTGKSTVCQILKQLGYSVVDADEVARMVVEPGSPGLKQVIEHFGVGVLGENQLLDRRKLGKLVFGKPEQLNLLESILHPLIRLEVFRRKQELERQGLPFAFYDVPLLFEKNMENQFDLIVVVATDPAQQVRRIQDRDKLSEDEIKQRLGSQIPIEKKKMAADFVIENMGSQEDLKKSIQDLIEKIQSKTA